MNESSAFIVTLLTDWQNIRIIEKKNRFEKSVYIYTYNLKVHLKRIQPDDARS